MERLATPEAIGILRGPAEAELVDVRTEAEHRRFTIPNSLSCPSSDLGLPLPARLPAEATSAGVTALAAHELACMGAREAPIHLDGPDRWRVAEPPVTTIPDCLSDASRIDHRFLTANRHSGCRNHALQCLAGKRRLPAQLHPWEQEANRLEVPTES